MSVSKSMIVIAPFAMVLTMVAGPVLAYGSGGPCRQDIQST
jgi:hypothetical protein